VQNISRIIYTARSESWTQRYANKKKLSDITKRINTVVATIASKDITSTNKMMKAVATVVSEVLEEKKKKTEKKNIKEPLWKRRMQSKIDELHKDVSRLEELIRGTKETKD